MKIIIDSQTKTIANKKITIVKKATDESKEKTLISEPDDHSNITISLSTLCDAIDVRSAGYSWFEKLKVQKETEATLIVQDIDNQYILWLIEGLMLGNYSFNKYKSAEPFVIKSLVTNAQLKQSDITRLQNLIEAVNWAKDQVNEPGNKLGTTEFAKRISQLCTQSGATVEILGKKKISALKMGGLLSVNLGSTEDPALGILTWKPENAINKKPIVLVGKGIVFDTGGYSIKTGNYMNDMKTDMAGAAAVAASVAYAAKQKLPIYVIGITPITDNRLQSAAMVPGDVIYMHNGTSVEVLNTDAEGRLILADGICYAQKFNPEVTISIATLTGAASVAIGPYASVVMGNNNKLLNKVIEAGNCASERLVNFPLWDEYAALIKSDIADLKNIGGREAGAITAGKFLEHFSTASPFIHIDIAGTAYIDKKLDYRHKGATGVGVRLFANFMENFQVAD